MMNLFSCFPLLLLITAGYSVLSVSLDGLAKQVHKGVDDVVKGTIEGATEVIGTPVDKKEVQFYLRTSNDGGKAKKLVDIPDLKSFSQTDSKIFFFIHGWTQNRTACPWYGPLTDLLLQKYPDAQIVQVDWGKPAGDNYASAAFSTESVGQIIAHVIQKIVKENNIHPERIVVIGHSLGGQVTGWVGKEYQKINNESLPRIIALDPAGPIFDVRPDSRRLNKHDAKVVMVLHSDMTKFGFPSHCGTIGFFPNGGKDQPGCLKLNLTDLSLSSLTDPLWCGHRRAHDLFIEAIKQPKEFMATKCESYEDYKSQKCSQKHKISMGDWKTTETGTFYLETSGEAPFINN